MESQTVRGSEINLVQTKESQFGKLEAKSECQNVYNIIQQKKIFELSTKKNI